MIFVTVGAYDLPFDRMIRAIDKIAPGIGEPLFAQIGHSVEPASGIEFERFLAFDRMQTLADEARIIITQGGPGSIMLALERGKVPIVIPRQQQFGEMVDDHQVLFAEKLAGEGKILLLMDAGDLEKTVRNYDALTAEMSVSPQALEAKAADFAQKLETLILETLADKTG